MKGIDPIWITVIAMIVAIDHNIGSGDIKLDHVFPAGWIPWIVGWAGFLGGILGYVLAALTTIISSKPGILIANPTATKIVVIVSVVVWSLFAFGGDARAQGVRLRPPQVTGDVVADAKANLGLAASAASPANTIDSAVANFNTGVQKIEKAIVDRGIADLTAAITDATNHNDNISLPCWKANMALLQSLPSQWETPPPLPIGLALGIQIQRDLLNSITGNDATSLKVACAALWGDQLKIVTNLGALIGIRIASGGIF